MAVRYRQGNNDDLAPLKSVAIDDDSATAWWGGAQKCFATVALAAVLATTALSTALAANIQHGDQSDVPAGSLVNLKVAEAYWQNPTRPVPATLYQALPYFFDPADSIPAPVNIPDDDEGWFNSVVPFQAKNYFNLPLGDDEEIPAGSLYGQPDEDFWRSGVAPVAGSNLWPQQWAFDVQESAGSLFGQYDEDFWRSGVSPVWWTNLWPQQFNFDIQEPAGSLYGQADEDNWQNPVRPVSASMRYALPLGDQDDVYPTTPATLATDEDFWQNKVAPVQASLFRSPAFRDADEIPAGFLYGQADEDFWANPIRPVQASFYQQLPYSFDSGDFARANIVSEDFWSNPAIPIAANVYQRLPYLFDPVEIASIQSGTALPAGLSLVAAENDPTASGQIPRAPGGSRPARRRARGAFPSVPPPIPQTIAAIVRVQGLSLQANHGRLSASGSATAHAKVPSLEVFVGNPTAKGIRNPTDEELIAILMGA